MRYTARDSIFWNWRKRNNKHHRSSVIFFNRSEWCYQTKNILFHSSNLCRCLIMIEHSFSIKIKARVLLLQKLFQRRFIFTIHDLHISFLFIAPHTLLYAIFSGQFELENGDKIISFAKKEIREFQCFANICFLLPHSWMITLIESLWCWEAKIKYRAHCSAKVRVFSLAKKNIWSVFAVIRLSSKQQLILQLCTGFWSVCIQCLISYYYSDLKMLSRDKQELQNFFNSEEFIQSID